MAVKTLNDRFVIILNELCDKHKIKKQKLYKSLSITPSHVSNIKSGRNLFTCSQIVNLISFDRDININWIFRGTGRMFEETQEAEIIIHNNHDDYFDIDTIIKTRQILSDKIYLKALDLHATIYQYDLLIKDYKDRIGGLSVTDPPMNLDAGRMLVRKIS